jgi:CheY-like chemotaxis protein
VRTVIGRPRGGALLIGGREVAMIFADVRLRGVMDGIDLAREAKMRWPLLPVILTSGHPRERLGELPPGVAYMPKPWQPLNVLTRELGGPRKAGTSRAGLEDIGLGRISEDVTERFCLACD